MPNIESETHQYRSVGSVSLSRAAASFSFMSIVIANLETSGWVKVIPEGILGSK